MRTNVPVTKRIKKKVEAISVHKKYQPPFSLMKFPTKKTRTDFPTVFFSKLVAPNDAEKILSIGNVMKKIKFPFFPLRLVNVYI